MAKYTTAGFSMLMALAINAGAWSDVWSTNATPRGMYSNVTIWVVQGELTNITATATNVITYWTHIGPNSNRFEHIQTNITIDTKQRREYEAAVSVGDLDDGLPGRVFWYRLRSREESGGELVTYDSLEYIKGVWSAAYANSAKRANLDAIMDSSIGDVAADRTYGGNPAVIYVKEVDETQTLAYLGMPTNWLSWTPTRNRHGWGPGLTETSTVSYVISTTNAGSVTMTNHIYDAFGTAASITGTNGQTVVVDPVACPIQPGFTSHDYGWSHVPRAYNAISWRFLAIPGISTESRRGLDAFTNSLADSVAYAESVYSSSVTTDLGVIYFSRQSGYGTNPPPPAWDVLIAGTESIQWTWNTAGFESPMLDRTGRVVVVGSPDAVAVYGEGDPSFDAQGSALTSGTNKLYVLWRDDTDLTNAAYADMSIFNNGAIPPNQPPEPPAGTSVTLGWYMSEETMAAFFIPTNHYQFIDPYADVTP